MPETTDTLRWTALRHRVLREVADDRIEVYHGLNASHVRKQTETTPREFLRGHEMRAVKYLHGAITYSYAGMGRCTPARLTTLGVALLHRWDAEHPEGGDHAAPDH